jgi:hypothetical protein
MSLEVILGVIGCICCTIGGAACMQMQNGGGMGGGLGRGHAHGGHDPQQAALNEAMMEQLQRQDRQERLDAYIQRRTRQTAEEVLRGKTPAEAAASPTANQAAAQNIAMHRPMPQVSFNFQHGAYQHHFETPLEKRIRENAPYHQTMF